MMEKFRQSKYFAFCLRSFFPFPSLYHPTFRMIASNAYQSQTLGHVAANRYKQSLLTSEKNSIIQFRP